jgi:hypothetical protein
MLYQYMKSSNTLEWKWSSGEKYERSIRLMKPPLEPIIPTEIINNNAFLQALTCDEPEPIHFAPLFRGESKREDIHNRLAEREMVAQVGRNPFLDVTKEHNYVNDVINQNQFLKPLSTNMDKVSSSIEK